MPRHAYVKRQTWRVERPHIAASIVPQAPPPKRLRHADLVHWQSDRSPSIRCRLRRRRPTYLLGVTGAISRVCRQARVERRTIGVLVRNRVVEIAFPAQRRKKGRIRDECGLNQRRQISPDVASHPGRNVRRSRGTGPGRATPCGLRRSPGTTPSLCQPAGSRQPAWAMVPSSLRPLAASSTQSPRGQRQTVQGQPHS
jgi:hypothetical protein